MNRIVPQIRKTFIFKPISRCMAHSENLTERAWIQPQGWDTGIKVYNCIARDKVPLILPFDRVATWYTCGPTVYDSAHIGHASCYVKLDIIQRILKNYFQINLITAMNITDIDDKILKRSQENGTDFKTISKRYENEFWHDLNSLNIAYPDFTIRVTDNINIIVEFVNKLIQKGVAYKGKDDSVYFSVEKYDNYGKLQKLNLENTKHDFKRSAEDFALWKTTKKDEPSFEAPFGAGRPGWHIECSAMASSIFGDHIDFHCGGIDLKFPHHENEEAQSCSYHSKNQWVNYWIHTGHLKLQDETEKMSKSLNNTITISDMLSVFTPESFRVACLLSNYRNGIEFGLNSMNNAEAVLNKFLQFFSDAKAYNEGAKPKRNYNSARIHEKIDEIRKKIDTALRDDFDTSKSIAHLLELIAFTSKIINNDSQDLQEFEQQLLPSAVQATSNFIFNHLELFGLSFLKDSEVVSDNSGIHIEGIVENIVKVRNDLRLTAKSNNNKELFLICDSIRDNLNVNGVEIKDHENSSSWSFKK